MTGYTTGWAVYNYSADEDSAVYSAIADNYKRDIGEPIKPTAYMWSDGKTWELIFDEPPYYAKTSVPLYSTPPSIPVQRAPDVDLVNLESWILRAQVSLRDGQPQVARIELENALGILGSERSHDR